MYVRGKAEAPARERRGLKTHVLLQQGDVAGSALAVTWVDVAPGGAQGRHSHAPEQVYVVVAGRGRMHVGAESRELGIGDIAHVPPDAPHWIVNTGEGVLSYVSCATPSFSQTGFYDDGRL